MPNPYSAEMRERVIARVESGGSRREAAEHFEISASAAVKWLQRWRDAGSSTAMPRGGSTSPLEKQSQARSLSVDVVRRQRHAAPTTAGADSFFANCGRRRWSSRMDLELLGRAAAT